MISAAFLSAWQSDLFGYDYDVPEMPLLPLTIWLVGLGALFMLMPALIKSTITTATHSQAGRLLFFLLAIGFVARLILFFSTPLMEDDFQRYMWDGAVTAHGYNPYKVNPKKVLHGEDPDPILAKLSDQSGSVLGRVNHPGLRTIYPPVAQGAFALAYFIKPFSLNAWRLVTLSSEIITVGFLLGLLTLTGRSALWVALYWWNPLIIKELVNSAHMDALLVPCLMGALYFSLKKKYALSTFLILLASAIKIWPIVLLPVLLRPLWPDWRKIIFYLAVFSVSFIVLMSPIFLAGLDQSSGFVAYVQKWQTNSAFFPTFNALWQNLLQPLGLARETINILSRLIVVSIVGLTALTLTLRPITDQKDMIARVLIIATTMFLLSPAQFPWYALWVLPLTVIFPVTALIALTALLPLYYFGFYLMVIEKHPLFAQYVVWLIWLPIWISLLWHFRHFLYQKLTFWQSGRQT